MLAKCVVSIYVMYFLVHICHVFSFLWLNKLIYLKEKPAELRSPSQASLHLR